MKKQKEVLESIRREMPGPRQAGKYFAWPACGRMPRSARYAREGFYRDWEKKGLRGILPWLEQLNPRVRPILAGFAGARPENIAFIPNTSWALNLLALSIDWQPGDEILTFAGEYPANIYPWQNLEILTREKWGFPADLAVKTRLLPPETGNQPENFSHYLSDNTRLVSFSLVQYASGLRPDLPGLVRKIREREAKQGRPIYIVVDGAQALGCVDFNFQTSGIDALAVSAHKWLLGDFGSAFAVFGPRVLRLPSLIAGAGSIRDQWVLEPYRLDFKTDAGRYEIGTQHFGGIFALEKSVDLLGRLSGPAREARLAKLRRALLFEGLGDSPWRVFQKDWQEDGPGRVSPLLCLEHPGIGPEKMGDFVDRLRKKTGLEASERGGRLRLGLHFFQRQKDARQLGQALARLGPR